MAKYLLVVADDFGAYAAIDNGIISAAKRGNIDCVDVFVTHSAYSVNSIQTFMSEFEDELDAKTLHLGLHLTLTCGKPVSTTISTKFRNMITYPSGEFRVMIHQNTDRIWKKFLEDLRKEMDAQLEKFIEITGYKPYHLSCHEGFFHLSEDLANVYFQFARDNQLFMRNPSLLSLQEGKWREVTQMQRTANSNILNILVKLGTKDAIRVKKWCGGGNVERINTERATGLRIPDYFLDHFFGVGELYKFYEILEKMDNGVYEMVVHPVLYDNYAEIHPPTGITRESFLYRIFETDTLRSASFSVRRHQKGVERFQFP